MGLDFVIGIEVKLSSNHTVEGKDGRLVRLTDICDELAGKYPKDFHFTGWHPHCRCVAVPILRKPGGEALGFRREALGDEVTDVPEGFRKWVEGHADKIAGWRERGNEPYFLRENRGRVDGVLKGKDASGDKAKDKVAEERERIAKKVNLATKPREVGSYASFEPFSPILMEKLSGVRDKKMKMKIYNELLNDPAFECIHTAENGCRTVVHPLHKTNDKYWEDTKKMAYALNRSGRDVIFLPEYENEKSADALTLVKGMPRVVDFKYSASTNWNTLQSHLKEGFVQAGCVVLKLEDMDAGQFRDTIEYMKRNRLPLGDFILINEYRRSMDLLRRDIMEGKYTKKIKGFL